jgi:predicted dehydrogenase
MISQEKLDGVLVLGPDELHVDHGIACIEKGIPILVEKPISRSLASAEKLCKFADKKKVPIMTVANKRYCPPYRRAKQFIEKGPVKNPAMYVGKFNLGYAYVDLFEAGSIHLFDLTRFFMGDVRTVSAVGVNKYGLNKNYYPVDNAIISFEFVSGSVGALYTSATALSLKPWERIEIYAQKTWLAVEDQYELVLYDDEQGPTKSWKPVVPNTLVFDEEIGGFMGLIENFLQVIRGKEKPVVTGWDGYYSYELNVAAHLSIAHREKVVLPLDPVAADAEVKQILKKK